MAGSELTRQGMALHRQGDLVEATRLYEAAVSVDPNDVDALHMLGVVRLQEGRFDDAIRLISLSLQHRPNAVNALCDAGFALQAAHRFEEAVAYYDRALALRPQDADTLVHRADALCALRRYEEACVDADRAIALRPDFAEAFRTRGHAALELGCAETAMSYLARALALQPRSADALADFGSVLLHLGRAAEALTCFDGVLELQPGSPNAHNKRGNALFALGRIGDAMAAYAEAVAGDPGDAMFRCNHGVAQFTLNLFDQALADFDAALRIRPDFAEALFARGHALVALERHEAAAASYAAAIAHAPNLPYAFGYLADARGHVCDWTDYDGTIRAVVEGIRSGRPTSGPLTLLALVDDPALQFACAQADQPIQGAGVSGRPALVPRARGRIRLAYFSADFRDHAVSRLIVELFELHDRSKFELTGFSFGPDTRDAMRARVAAAFDRFIDVRGKSDEEVALLARELGIDVAIDLMGFTRGSRSGIFALRVAPVQVNYLGYPGTMRCDLVDYIIADSFVIPAGDECHYAEQIVRLPDCYQANDSKRHIALRTPHRSELGLPERAFVFCCFNNSFKIKPPIFDVWMRLLQQVDESVLWLLAPNEAVRRNLGAEAERRGVASARLVFAPRAPFDKHLARHRLADLFLDTLPWNAHTTASDALWAGLPLLTCAGRAFAARVAGSLLHAMAMPELVTDSLTAYEARALALAGSPAQMRELRDKVGRNRLAAPLFRTDLFRRHIESAYLTMWETFRRGERPHGFTVPRVGD